MRSPSPQVIVPTFAIPVPMSPGGYAPVGVNYLNMYAMQQPFVMNNALFANHYGHPRLSQDNIYRQTLQRNPLHHAIAEPFSSSLVSHDNLMKTKATHDLVNALVKSPFLSSSLNSLSQTSCLSHHEILQIVEKTPSIFKMYNEQIFMKPDIKICSDHPGSKGCQNLTSCTSLHLCYNHLNNSCEDLYCILGHNLRTTHNTKIFVKFLIDALDSNALGDLLRILLLPQGTKYLKVCLPYNEDFCKMQNCHEIHLCMEFLSNSSLTCHAYCPLNHDPLSDDVVAILYLWGYSINETPKDILIQIKSAPLIEEQIISFRSKQKSDLKETTGKAIWDHYYEGEVEIPEICLNSVHSHCPLEQEGCWRLHSAHDFHWQVRESKDCSKWLNLPFFQVEMLEEAYCNVKTTKFSLPPLDAAKLDKPLHGLLNILKNKKKWKAHFDLMILRDSEGTCHDLRRLCTEFRGTPIPECCLFVWYFYDDKGAWVPYDSPDRKDKMSSKKIEKAFKTSKALNLAIFEETYTLDFDTMTQTNMTTLQETKVRRRPTPHWKA